MLITDYEAYFKNLCINHPDLQHADVNGSKVFRMIHIEEALSDFRSGTVEKGLIFRLINYTFDIKDNYTADQTRWKQGAFIVASSHGKGKSDEQMAAMAKAERILMDFVERMIHDSQEGNPLFYYTLNTAKGISAQPIIFTGDLTYSGWMAIFDFGDFVPNCITREGGPLWLDLNPSES
jgi:hypothetical protein